MLVTLHIRFKISIEQDNLELVTINTIFGVATMPLWFHSLTLLHGTVWALPLHALKLKLYYLKSFVDRRKQTSTYPFYLAFRNNFVGICEVPSLENYEKWLQYFHKTVGAHYNKWWMMYDQRISIKHEIWVPSSQSRWDGLNLLILF